MVKDDIPERNKFANDVFSIDSDEDDFQEQRDEDTGIRQNVQSTEQVWRRQIAHPLLELGLVTNFHTLQIIQFLPPHVLEHMLINPHAAPRPHTYTGMPPPPIAMTIPVYHPPLGAPPKKIFKVWFKCRRLSSRYRVLENSRFLFSERQHRVRLQLPSPTSMEHRFRPQPLHQLCIVSGQAPHRRHTFPRSPSMSPPRPAGVPYDHYHPRGGRPRPPAMAAARQPKLHFTKRISRKSRRRRCRCKMNVVDFEVTLCDNPHQQVENNEAHDDEEEEEEGEAYEDRHRADDNSRESFSDDDSSYNDALQNVQIAF